MAKYNNKKVMITDVDPQSRLFAVKNILLGKTGSFIGNLYDDGWCRGSLVFDNSFRFKGRLTCEWNFDDVDFCAFKVKVL